MSDFEKKDKISSEPERFVRAFNPKGAEKFITDAITVATFSSAMVMRLSDEARLRKQRLSEQLKKPTIIIKVERRDGWESYINHNPDQTLDPVAEENRRSLRLIYLNDPENE